jgi:hypothetical protein
LIAVSDLHDSRELMVSRKRYFWKSQAGMD